MPADRVLLAAAPCPFVTNDRLGETLAMMGAGEVAMSIRTSMEKAEHSVSRLGQRKTFLV